MKNGVERIAKDCSLIKLKYIVQCYQKGAKNLEGLLIIAVGVGTARLEDDLFEVHTWKRRRVREEEEPSFGRKPREITLSVSKTEPVIEDQLPEHEEKSFWRERTWLRPSREREAAEKRGALFN